MISHEITLFPTNEIVVDWNARYARDAMDEGLIDSLASDIAKNDLIHTILIEKGSNRLLAGGHRLAAFIQLDAENVPCPNTHYKEWKKIPVRFAFNIAPGEAELIELVENIKRRNISWSSRAEQVVRLHEDQNRRNRTWTADNTAKFIGCSPTEVRQSVRVVRYLEAPELKETLKECSTLNAAYAIVVRHENRAKADHMEVLLGAPGLPDTTTMPVKTAKVQEAQKLSQESLSSFVPFPMLNMSFEDFASSYEGPNFNFFHCDPPYGIDLCKKKGMKTTVDWLDYSDTDEDFTSFMSTLSNFCTKHSAASAHMILWYSQMREPWLFSFLAKEMSDWHIQEFRLIWHYSDNAGIVPDPQRYGRRNYETALCLVRGDRLITKPASLCLSFPKSNKNAVHRSQKHFEVSLHFMRMFVDEYSICLDPGAGSGAPLQAMYTLGAQHIVGLERDLAIFEAAKESWNTFMVEKHQ